MPLQDLQVVKLLDLEQGGMQLRGILVKVAGTAAPLLQLQGAGMQLQHPAA